MDKPTPELSLEKLEARAWEIQERVIRITEKKRANRHSAKLWEAAEADLRAGYCQGPFYS